jgi:hypothetical protein
MLKQRVEGRQQKAESRQQTAESREQEAGGIGQKAEIRPGAERRKDMSEFILLSSRVQRASYVAPRRWQRQREQKRVESREEREREGGQIQEQYK